jgi:hypothetical protein
MNLRLLKRLRRLGAASLLIVTCLCGAPAQAQSGVDQDRKVTLALKDSPLRAAIDALFQGSGLQYAIDPNVPNVPVTINLRDVGFQAALRILVRQAAVAVPGLTSSREGDVYMIRIRPPAPPVQLATEDVPPEYTDEESKPTWDRIVIQFNNVAVFVLAFGGQMLPTEADVLLGNQNGGQNGNGQSGGYGQQQGLGNNNNLFGNSNSFGSSNSFGNSNPFNSGNSYTGRF